MHHHISDLCSLLERFKEYNLNIAPSKSRLGANEIKFLRHMVNPADIGPDSDKVAGLDPPPIPADQTQVRSLLGGLSYYPKFLQNLAKRVTPITHLLKKGIPFEFPPEHVSVIRATFFDLASSEFLTYPDIRAAIGWLSQVPPSCRRQHS
ncbi:unnamed protein product [Discosporangium mesarthrocarpum]